MQEGVPLISATELWDTATTKKKKKGKNKTTFFFESFQATNVFCIFKQWQAGIDQVISPLTFSEAGKNADNAINTDEVLASLGFKKLTLNSMIPSKQCLAKLAATEVKTR